MTDISSTNYRRTLDYCKKHAPQYMRSVYCAFLDNRLDVSLIVPRDSDFEFNSDKPVITTVSDDIGGSYGPSGFNTNDITSLLKKCSAVVVISANPEAHFYDDAVAVAVHELVNIAIIETTQRHENEWLKFAVQINPEIRWALWSALAHGVA